MSNGIDKLLETPYWVIDLLPAQVPAERGKRFFKIEPELLKGARGRFADVLLKLNCYCDFVVYTDEGKKGKTNPKTKKLRKLVLKDRKDLCILLPGEDALLTVPTESTCMTLYNPSEDLLDLVSYIAVSAGLFVWQPPA